jgi:AcrR family transcriptional regulator
MSPRQLERRRNLIEAATQLVAEMGVERVQMKHVSERSGVALGTAYRYFSSKDHLLAAAVADWWARLLTDLAAAGPAVAVGPDEPADRVVNFVHRGLRAFQRQPQMAHLLVSVAVSTDPFASEAVQRMARVGQESLRTILPELPPPVDSVVPHLIDSAWQGELIAWVTGRATLADAYRRLEEVIRLLLPQAAVRSY